MRTKLMRWQGQYTYTNVFLSVDNVMWSLTHCLIWQGFQMCFPFSFVFALFSLYVLFQVGHSPDKASLLLRIFFIFIFSNFVLFLYLLFQVGHSPDKASLLLRIFFIFIFSNFVLFLYLLFQVGHSPDKASLLLRIFFIFIFSNFVLFLYLLFQVGHSPDKASILAMVQEILHGGFRSFRFAEQYYLRPGEANIRARGA